MQYSIWIIPSEPTYSKIKAVIDNLVKKYHSQTFNPHLTIIGNINHDLNEIKRAINKSVLNFKPLKLSLGPISFSTTYYQSVFVRVKSNAKLMQLNLNIKKQLNLNNEVYMPHISLIYDNLDMTEREKIARNINLPNSTFIGKELVIVPITDNPSTWKPQATISLL